jgi:hypothetical protein
MRTAGSADIIAIKAVGIIDLMERLIEFDPALLKRLSNVLDKALYSLTPRNEDIKAKNVPAVPKADVSNWPALIIVIARKRSSEEIVDIMLSPVPLSLYMAE